MDQPLNVLLIDDSPDDAELAVRELRSGGRDVVPRRVDSREALAAALAEQRWDIVLSDFSMPGFSGEEALRMVRAADSNVPFIIMSGIIGEETAVAMMRAGAQDFIMKDRLGRLVPVVERELREAENSRVRKAQHDALLESEEKFSTIFRQAPLLITLSDIDSGRLIDVNEKFLEVSGFTRNEAIGRTVLELGWISAGQRAEMVRLLREHGRVEDLELDLRSRDGRSIACSFCGERITVKGKQCLLAIAQDVTERKRADAALRESQRFLQTIIDSVAEPIMVIGTDYRVLMLNNAARGNSSIGTLCHEISHHSATPCAGAADACPLDQVRATGRPVAVVHEHADGRGNTACIEILASPFYGPDGALLGIIESCRDITGRIRAEQEKLRLERQVQHAQKLESLGVLAGGIAHDFNNILMGILGNAGLALLRLPAGAAGRPNIIEIEKAARRAADLSSQMLAYSGKGRFRIEPIDLNRLVGEMGRLLEVSISKKAELRYEFERDIPLFDGDATQVRQIVMNLITNASEALGDAGGSIVLSTGVASYDRRSLDETNEMLLAGYDEPLPEGSYVHLEVSDTGCGMSDETQRKIFDPFFTTKFTGRGLGMAAVLGILRGHRGAIRITSEVGRGTVIRVLFPAGAARIATSAPTEQPPGAAWRGSGTVLLVDDDPTVCAVGSEMLRLIGFDVLTATDGRMAVDAFRRSADSIAVVLLDLTMPKMGGEEVFSELKRIRPDARVVLCSGFTEQDATARLMDRGLSAFLQKPYDVAQLSRALRTALDSGGKNAGERSLTPAE